MTIEKTLKFAQLLFYFSYNSDGKGTREIKIITNIIWTSKNKKVDTYHPYSCLVPDTSCIDNTDSDFAAAYR